MKVILHSQDGYTSEIFPSRERQMMLPNSGNANYPAWRGAAGPHDACKECAPLIRGATMGLIGVPRRADLHGFLTARALLARSYVSVTLCAPRREPYCARASVPPHRHLRIRATACPLSSRYIISKLTNME